MVPSVQRQEELSVSKHADEEIVIYLGFSKPQHIH